MPAARRVRPRTRPPTRRPPDQLSGNRRPEQAQAARRVVNEACDTGLGDLAGGEGTFGLQRAFHLAGTRDVVASLWKVSDHATAALMADFYCNLWVKNMSPLEALRQAQPAIYRGTPSLSVSVAILQRANASTGNGRSRMSRTTSRRSRRFASASQKLDAGPVSRSSASLASIATAFAWSPDSW